MTSSPIRHLLQARWLPQTFAARIFLVFAMTTFLGTVVGLVLLNYQQFSQHVQETRASIGKLAEVSLQPITDSAVVSDYDAIARLLRRIVPDSPLQEAVFIDATGGTIRASNDTQSDAPAWLATLVSHSVPDLQHEIAIGGRRYGELVLRYNPALVADGLWDLLLKTIGLATVGLCLSLVVMRYAMRRWLRTLDGLDALEAKVMAGSLDAQVTLTDDAPLEIRKAIEVVNRTAGSLRAQFGQRIDTLMHSLIQHKNAMDVAAIVCELDLQGRLISANEGFLTAVGLPLHQLKDTLLQDIGRPQSETDVQQAHEALNEPNKIWRPSRDIWHGEVQVVDVFGTVHVHRRSVVPIFNSADEVEKYICIDFDITMQKASELALMDQMHRQNIITTFGYQALEEEDLQRLMHQAVQWVCAGLNVRHATLLMKEDAMSTPQIQVGLGWVAGWVGRPAVLQPRPPQVKCIWLCPTKCCKHMA